MKSLKLILVSLLSTIMLGVMFIFFINGYQNKAINLEEQIKTAQADIEVQEKRRVDLVYNLVDTVKNYDKHEAETLKGIVEARGSKGMSLSEVTTALNVTIEAYPKLKANENYKTLMTELSVTENLIAEHRSNYNKQVRAYNRYVKKFPTRYFLNTLGYEPIEATYLEYNAPSDAPQNLFGE